MVKKQSEYAEEQQMKLVQVAEDANQNYIMQTRVYYDKMKKEYDSLMKENDKVWQDRCNRQTEKVLQTELGCNRLKKGIQFFNLQHAMEKWKYGAKVKKVIERVDGLYNKLFPKETAKELNEQLKTLVTDLLSPKVLMNQQ